MEIVLQWFDELDDLVISGLSLWQAMRRFCLVFGFVAASGLHLLPAFGFAVERLLPLHDAALVALVLWTLCAAISASAERSSKAHTTRA
jgi:hypothetical protein